MHPNRIQQREEGSTKPLEHGKVYLSAQGEFTITHGGGKASPGNAVPSLLLLFSRGNCPDAASVRTALERVPEMSISLDHGDQGDLSDSANDSQHADTPSVQNDGPWLELVTGALTFELRGFRDGTNDALFAQKQTAGLAQSPEAHDLGFKKALHLRVSPHLTDGAMVTPILRGLFKAASKLGAQLPGLVGFGWPKAAAALSAEHFHMLVEQWAEAGPLPIDLFIRFRDELDQGLASRGLAAFTGQELRLEPELVEDRSIAERLGQRLAAQLIPMGKLTQSQDFSMPDGRNLRLEPSKNRRFVRAFLR